MNTDRDVHGILKEGIRTVNRALFEAASENPDLIGTGSTLVAATIKGNVLYVANIGDSVCIFCGSSWSR